MKPDKKSIPESSVWVDWKIVFMTVKAVLRKQGASRSRESCCKLRRTGSWRKKLFVNTTELTTQDQEDDVPEIDLGRLLNALRKSAWLLLLMALTFGNAAYIGTKLLIVPTYQSSFTAYVNNRDTESSQVTSMTSSDVTATQTLVYTYTNLLTSRTVVMSAAEEAGLDYEYQDLENAVSTSSVSNTGIITVTVTMTDPYEALALADAICRQSPAYTASVVQGTSMQIIDEPLLPEDIAGPGYRKNMLLGTVVGGVAAAAVVIVKELLDDHVKDGDELEKRTGIAVIGTIHDLNVKLEEKCGDYGYGYGSGKDGQA